MFDIIDHPIVCVLLLFVGVIICICLLLFAIQLINIHFIDCIPSEVYVDGELVYKGSSAGFEVDSAGSNTTVTITGGFLYLFPQKYYTSKDIKVVGFKN